MKVVVKLTVQDCKECWIVDPTLVHWQKRSLEVDSSCCQLFMDITHYNGIPFLTLIDCDLMLFTIWHPLACQDASTAK